jgi:hypothetical protein
MKNKKTITLQFELKELMNFDVQMRYKSFCVEYLDQNKQIIKLKKYSELSKIEKEIKRSMIEKANRKFNDNVQFQSEMIFVSRDPQSKSSSILIINGSCSEIRFGQNKINIECKLDNAKYEMQIIKIQKLDLEADDIMKEVAICSEDTNEKNKIVVID